MSNEQRAMSNCPLPINYMLKNVLAAILKVAILSTLLVATFPRISTGYTSPNVPLKHWSYDALERLTASGIINTVMLNERPLSRMEIAEILSRIPGTTSVSSPILRQDISRLEREYKDELIRLGKQPATGRLAWYRIADPISWELIYTDIEGLKRTPRENYWGEYFYDGITNQVLFRTWANPGEYIVVDIAPKFRVYRDGYDASFQEAYIKTSIYNIALEAGRDSIWWGPGFHGSLILSNNALPFSLVKIESYRPFPLPGWFSILGLWDISAFLTQLESDRDFPEAKLAGMRIGLIPAKFMEVNFTRTIIFGGEGRPALDPIDYMKVFFAIGENKPGKLNNDQLGGIDIRLSIPVKGMAEGLSIYGQLIGEDEAGGLPSSHGFLAGFFVCDLFNAGLFDVRMEYADQPVKEEDGARYIHGVYTNGYTYHNRVIGHPMGVYEDNYFNNGVFSGVNAWDMFFRTTIHIGQYIDMGIQYDYEQHRVSKPEEKRQEAVIDLSGRMADNVILKIAQEYERIDNSRGIEGQGIDNYYFWGKVEVFY